MTKVRIRDLLNTLSTGTDVQANGWVRSIRIAKEVTFITINDGSCLQSLQIVVDPDVDGYQDIIRSGTGAALEVRGHLVESPSAGQSVELKARSVTVIGSSDENYPLQKKRHSFEYLRSIAHLRLRTNTFGAIFRLRSSLSHAIHSFFADRGFVYIHSPIITANDCEGAGELFRVTTLDPYVLPSTGGRIDYSKDFFGQATSLTVSGQLEGELAAMAFRDIYTFGPTFRAENSNTSRHAAEFWMIEPEMAFADLQDDIELAESFFRHLCRHALSHCADDMAFFDEHVQRGLLERIRAVSESSFQVMDYTEAISRLQSASTSFQYPVAWGVDLQTEHERYLCEQVVGGPMFVINYPAEIKAFYMRQNDDGKTVSAMDLLVPRVGEIIGGSQREERQELLVQRMVESGIDPASLWWYCESRRWGSTPHAGFGLGFERMLMYLTGMENIRDVIPFPRTPGHAEF